MNDKLNIGLFLDCFYPVVDGVVMVVDNYARCLKDIANVTVFVPKGKKFFDDSTLPYKVVRCNSFKIPFFDYDLPMPKANNKFIKEIDAAKLDIIHIHSPFQIGKLATAYGNKHNIPVVVTMHSQYKRDFYRATHSKLITKMLLKNISKIYNKCDVLWTMNEACVNISRAYGYKGKIEIISNATNLKNNYTEKELVSIKNEVRKKYNITDDTKVLLSIGRLNKLKNIDLTLSACKELKNLNFKYKLFIIGDGADRLYFENKAKQLGVNDSCLFLGKIVDTEEKCKLFASADLHVFPSFYDTDGIVRIEAAAFKLPTLFAKDSVASSAIKDKVNGYIAKATPQDTANEIIRIFNNPTEYKSVCENCHKDIYITFEDLIHTVYQKYLSIISEKRNS